MTQPRKSRVQLRYASPSDSANYIKVIVDCFANSMFNRNVYRGVELAPRVIYKEIENYRNFTKPDAHLIEAVDSTTNKPLGYARWGIPPEHGIEIGSPRLTEEEAERLGNIEKYMPNGVRKDLERGATKFVIEKRKEYMKKGDITLEILCIDPAHQGEGIGTELLKWGMDIADKKGAGIYLEATPAGCPLYLKYGWRVLGEIKHDFSKEGGDGVWEYLLMVRDPLIRQDGI